MDWRECSSFYILVMNDIGLYLDTTYCNPRYTFPEQSVPIDFVAKSVLDELEHERKTVVLVGTYQIGKERILKGIADHCHCKIFVDRQKYVCCLCIFLFIRPLPFFRYLEFGFCEEGDDISRL